MDDSIHGDNDRAKCITKKKPIWQDLLLKILLGKASCHEHSRSFTHKPRNNTDIPEELMYHMEGRLS